MKKTKTHKPVLFAHSAGPQYAPGKGSYDLVKYLKKNLPAEYKIYFPKIEKPGEPSYSKYKKMFANSFSRIAEPVLLIGHSLGGSTLLKYLSEERPPVSIAGLFLVSTPHWTGDMKEFVLKENFQEYLPKIPAVFLYHSKEDADVPFESLLFYKAAFKKATVRELPGNEHIFSNGLPALVSDIQSLVRRS